MKRFYVTIRENSKRANIIKNTKKPIPPKKSKTTETFKEYYTPELIYFVIVIIAKCIMSRSNSS